MKDLKPNLLAGVNFTNSIEQLNDLSLYTINK